MVLDLGANWGIDISPTLSDDRLSTARSVAFAGGSTGDSINILIEFGRIADLIDRQNCRLIVRKIFRLVHIALYIRSAAICVNKYLLSYGQLCLSWFVSGHARL